MVKTELKDSQIMCKCLWFYINPFISFPLQTVVWGSAWKDRHLDSRESSHQQDSQRYGQHNNREMFTVHFFSSQPCSFLLPLSVAASAHVAKQHSEKSYEHSHSSVGDRSKTYSSGAAWTWVYKVQRSIYFRAGTLQRTKSQLLPSVSFFQVLLLSSF